MKKTLEFLTIILITTAITSYKVGHCSQNQNSLSTLLQPPQKTTPEEIEKLVNVMPLQFTWSGENLSITFAYKNGNSCLRIRFFNSLSETLTPEEKATFKVKTQKINNQQSKIFTFQHGDKNLLQNPKDGQSDYHLATPLDLQKYKPLPGRVSTDRLAEIIRNKKVIFYTGAGISAEGNVFTMQELETALCLGDLRYKKTETLFTKIALQNPEELLDRFSKFCTSMLNSPPTPAHLALKNIAEFKCTQILTENLDLLHERSGIVPQRIIASEFKKVIKPEWSKEVDVIVCIGLSYDDKDLLSWYKQNNPKGTIIAIDFKQPSYLGNKDFLVEGNLQEILPVVQGLLI